MNLEYNELIDLIKKHDEILEKGKNVSKEETIKRNTRYLKNNLKLNYNGYRFGMKPEIDPSKNIQEITKDLRKYKDIDEWVDEDGTRRYSRLRIITKV